MKKYGTRKLFQNPCSSAVYHEFLDTFRMKRETNWRKGLSCHFDDYLRGL